LSAIIMRHMWHAMPCHPYHNSPFITFITFIPFATISVPFRSVPSLLPSHNFTDL
jgi:hypothetical protein